MLNDFLHKKQLDIEPSFCHEYVFLGNTGVGISFVLISLLVPFSFILSMTIENDKGDLFFSFIPMFKQRYYNNKYYLYTIYFK
tara:strand:+ start:101 stop:349 length:249 start_codon:yes stop_codon:yes gene_type:complete